MSARFRVGGRGLYGLWGFSRGGVDRCDAGLGDGRRGGISDAVMVLRYRGSDDGKVFACRFRRRGIVCYPLR